LYDNLPKSNSHIANSFELVNKLNNFYIEEHMEIVPLDVINLFTNIPYDLIIGSIAKKWHFLEPNTDIPYEEFVRAFRLILDSTYFMFNDIIYKHIFGTPMGSHLY